ncbi:hypothetical protein Dthio_PD0905 [Desulfonatronospira thiodismutans ASO3-1]|uniref:DUF697 domain-containing protein n=1 Tax=Desulfonatronospira thiodismutans ASO3-1 TaxID=555779 RepID=D6SSA5_9BACT|nr:DUF697 domain-containing protein [Desulfonatronospira thiodismutans]EFI33571.1 hypothetical protein Dthio_PD0905 [Desulfonatronospira thiodismutans ASO3-1]
MSKKRQVLIGDPLDQVPEGREQESREQKDQDARQVEGSGKTGNETSDAGYRRRDSGLGQPDPEPGRDHDVRDVSPEEMQELRREQEKLKRQLEEKMLDLERTGIRIPRVIYRTALWTAVFLGAVLGLFLVSQGVRFAGQVAALNMPWNILAVSGFALFSAMILMVIIKLAGRFLAFRSLSKVDINALKMLAQRRRFRWLAQQKQDEAREVLAGYLKDYKVKDVDADTLGLDRQELARIDSYRQNLLDSYGHLDSATWLKQMDETFVHALDRAANRRIRLYSRNVGLGTAASPIKFIDQLIVLYASLKLISELLQIYNLRPAMGQSLTILARSIIQAYLSGIIGEHSEAGVETFGDYYESIFGEISFATGVSAAADATRYALPKAGEGALNGFLVWRLGRHARRMVRPI